MIGILLTAVLSSSAGQAPLIMSNSMNNYPNILKHQDPSSGYDASAGSGAGGSAMGGYPVSQTYPLNAAVGSTLGYGSGYYGGGYYPWYGGYGGYPGYGYGCGYGGYPWMAQPYCCYAAPVACSTASSFVGDQDREGARDHRELNRRLEEIKGTLERDVKGTLDKLSDSLKQTEKRLEATEKIGISTEGRVKWLEEEIKQRLYWQDLEKKLDSRLKPLEQQLLELNKKLDKHDEALRKHDEKLRRQIEDLERRPRDMPKPGEPKVEDPFKSIENKLDRLQGNITKDMTSVLTRLVELEQMIKEERLRREKIEERLKKLEKVPAPPKEGEAGIPGQDNAPKQNDAAPKEPPMNREAALPKVRVAQVSLPKQSVPPNKALVIVSLPADAKLYLNDQLTHIQGAVRSFVTPELAPEGTFGYTFRMEVMQNGAHRTQTQNVTFRPGQRIIVDFGNGSETRVAVGEK